MRSRSLSRHQTATGCTGCISPPIVANEPETARTLILGFGGNVWNAQDVAVELHQLFLHAHVVAFHYRGYRPSTGRPSARALLADAPLGHDAAVARVRPARTIAVGFSIGSGVAASLVRQRQLDGLILVTPFDSLKSVAAELFPWLPVGLFFKHEMDAAGCLEGSRVSVAIIAAGRDDVIPRSRTNALRARVPRLVFDRTIRGASHNDLYARAEFERAMRDGLAVVTRRERQKTRPAERRQTHVILQCQRRYTVKAGTHFGERGRSPRR